MSNLPKIAMHFDIIDAATGAIVVAATNEIDTMRLHNAVCKAKLDAAAAGREAVLVCRPNDSPTLTWYYGEQENNKFARKAMIDVEIWGEFLESLDLAGI